MPRSRPAVAHTEPAAPPLTPDGELFVRAVGAATDLPAFVRNVQSIGTVATDQRTRVALLESAIVRDLALTAKVLRVANAASIGAGGGSGVTTVKQAIMLLGFERVQQLSVATAVFENIERSTPAVQDLLVLSVLTANQGLCVAVEAAYARPETAYLCGLFRHLGELLVACYRPRQYHEWLARAATLPHRAPGAEERTLGFSFDSVGRALAAQWGMMPDLVRTMAHLPTPSVPADDALPTIVQFATECARVRYLGVDDGDADDAERELLLRWTRPLGLDRKRLYDVIAMAEVESRPTLDGMHIALDTWRAQRRVRVAVAAALDHAAHDAAADSVSDDAASPVARTDAALSAIEHACAPNAGDSTHVADVRDAVRRLTLARRDADAAFDVGAMTGSTLDTLRAAGYARVLLALSTEDFRMVRGRVATGRDADTMQRNFVVRPSAAFGILGAALKERRDTFGTYDAQDTATRRDRVLRELAPRAYALLPLVLDDKLLGCLYFDHPDEDVVVTDDLRTLLGHARDHLVAAFRKRQDETKSAA